MFVAVVGLLVGLPIQLNSVLVKQPAPAAPFAGKVVFLTFNTPSTPIVVLQDAQVRQLGGKAFLVGKGVTATGEGFTADRPTWVAVDTIAQVVEFNSVDEVRRRYRDQRQTQTK